jgi:hypothetical protein
MISPLKAIPFALSSLLAFSVVTVAQDKQSNAPPPHQQTLMDRLYQTPTSGPAPRRDLTGAWAGPIFATINPIPPLTPLGEELSKANKNAIDHSILESNDPLKTCDPLGFPRFILHETRGIMFAAMPDRVLQMSQYNRSWREIFTDGRELPKNVGARTVRQSQSPGPWLSTFSNSTDPRWFGYSVGHWEGDYAFVIETVGSDARSWMDRPGHPHSIDLKVMERYTRIDHDTMTLEVSIDDPQVYTRSFVITTSTFKWIPLQEFEEQICVPSEQLDYLRYVAEPAGAPEPSRTDGQSDQ